MKFNRITSALSIGISVLFASAANAAPAGSNSFFALPPQPVPEPTTFVAVVIGIIATGLIVAFRKLAAMRADNC